MTIRADASPILAGLLLVAPLALLVHAARGAGEESETPHGDLSIPCASCHTTDSWRVDRPPSFSHEETGYPLEGLHATVPCAGCHLDLVFPHVGVSCADCHLDVHDGELGVSCAGCHDESGFEHAFSLQDHAATLFPLLGAHARVECEACHRGTEPAEYVATPVACEGCHLAQALSATSFDHAGSGLTTGCEECHSPVHPSWSPADFDHHTWPLTGRHARTECAACHEGGYSGTPRECVGCHREEYDAASEPDHLLAAFAVTCQDCHTTSSWDGDFVHTIWPLTGRHVDVACASCHISGYAATPRECEGCHLPDYVATTSPDHVAAGYPATCASCHGTASWDAEDLDHDIRYFPIYSGKHREEWTDCADCHVTPTDFSHFECIFCHEHRQSETDDEHGEVSGYVYSSITCLDCHPRGEED